MTLPKPVVAALAVVPLAFGAGLGIAALADGGDDRAGPPNRPPSESDGPGPKIDLPGRAAAIPPLRRTPRATTPSSPPVSEQEPSPTTPPPSSGTSPGFTAPDNGGGGGGSQQQPEQPRPEPEQPSIVE